MKLKFGGLALALFAVAHWAGAQSVAQTASDALPPAPPAPPGAMTSQPMPSEERVPSAAPTPREPRAAVPPQPQQSEAGAQQPGKTRSWYGWQLLSADALSLSLVAVAVGASGTSNDNGMLTAGALGYVFAPALIHVVHGRPGMAPASASVRAFVPAVGFLLGSAATDCRSEGGGDGAFCGGAGPAVGLFVGVAIASALDAALFSWDKPQTNAAAQPELGLVPVLSPDGKRAELRAFGTF
jgi:hypothetical protein